MNQPIDDASSFERLLRENGFSRSRAKAITAEGFKAQGFGNETQTLITETVNQLRCRERLIRKRTRRGTKFPTLTAAAREIVETMADAYKAINGTPQPMRLFEGDPPKHFTLGLKNMFNPTVSVEVPPMGFHYFECEIRYWKWTSSGPKRDRKWLFLRENTSQLSVKLETGNTANLLNWARKQVSKVKTADGQIVYEIPDTISLLSEFLKEPTPSGQIEYKKFFLGGNIGEAVRRSRHAFRITARS